MKNKTFCEVCKIPMRKKGTVIKVITEEGIETWFRFKCPKCGIEK